MAFVLAVPLWESVCAVAADAVTEEGVTAVCEEAAGKGVEKGIEKACQGSGKRIVDWFWKRLCKRHPTLKQHEAAKAIKKAVKKEVKKKAKEEGKEAKDKIDGDHSDDEQFVKDDKKQPLRIKKVGGAAGWVVHGFYFEFTDGSRIGEFLDNDQAEMSLYDSDGLKRRGLKEYILDEDEHITSVGGCYSQIGYLAGILFFGTSKGQQFVFQGDNPEVHGPDFKYLVDNETAQGICDIDLQDGGCIGIVKKFL